MGRSAGVVAVVLLLACWCGPAQAFRPFDGTDAAVADLHQIEIELGPVEYLRDGAQRTLFAPSTVFNYGFTPGWEGVIEGRVAHALSGRGVLGAGLIDAGAFLKGVLREGALQDKAGPSVATEFGILLPGIRDDHGIGASIAGVLSQRWGWGMIHLNAAASLTRQQHPDLFLDAIIEGPYAWTVRPVAELFYDRDFAATATRSALVGAIWQVKDDVAVDFGLRGARSGDHTAGEIRLGITIAFSAR
ncbi:MAG TPA: hypothetical protein VJ770_22300 [Stellaceae bacterium]|nr:hypothetical protein [Stellaceae bacterium]